MTEPLFVLRDLQKSYRGRVVLDIPQLTLYSGQSYALIGANGSGKSTLLRLLAGMIAPTAGSIESCYPPQDIAYLPQKPYAFSFSVLRNLTMALPAGAADKQTTALAALKEVGLDSLQAARGDRLSGGESQRLSVARLLMGKQRLLLLDEPTSATDIAGNELIESALKNYRRRHHCDLIFATHALSQAARMADQVLFFAGGRIVEQGETARLLHHPQSAECQAFLRFWQNS
ncbi:MAG: ATP-binding cassette domain-containing protein [Bacillota bacterium]|nr:ATP-binding cassette domain-containing protein [Bacillota bacterium]